MRTTAAATLSCSMLAAPSLGVSDTALFIRKESLRNRDALWNSLSLGHSDALRDLERVADDCRSEGWDGYDGAPVHRTTILHALAFVRALPLGVPCPTVSAEPDGQVTLEWHRSPRRLLSVSASPDGNLHYAATLGASSQFGTEPFLGDVPPSILEMIVRVCGT